MGAVFSDALSEKKDDIRGHQLSNIFINQKYNWDCGIASLLM